MNYNIVGTSKDAYIIASIAYPNLSIIFGFKIWYFKTKGLYMFYLISSFNYS